ncbi:hypothetical protein GCM10028793_64830 [Nocardiopsis oceani]
MKTASAPYDRAALPGRLDVTFKVSGTVTGPGPEQRVWKDGDGELAERLGLGPGDLDAARWPYRGPVTGRVSLKGL